MVCQSGLAEAEYLRRLATGAHLTVNTRNERLASDGHQIPESSETDSLLPVA